MVKNDSAAAPQSQAPRFATAWAALVYAVATFSLAYPALGGNFLINPRSDQYLAGFAFRDFAAAALRAGEGIPQWNPYLYGGMPYIGAMHGDIFYPTFLLRMMMPTDLGMTWGFVIHLFLAGFFTFGFLRAWGVGFYGSLVGGLAYMLSGPIAAYASPGHDGKLFVSALLPLALWMLVRGVRDGRTWAWGIFALTIGLAVISPHPQLLQYLLLVSGSFALFLALTAGNDGHKLPRDVAVGRLALAFSGVVLGGMIGAIQYLPLLGQPLLKYLLLLAGVAALAVGLLPPLVRRAPRPALIKGGLIGATVLAAAIVAIQFLPAINGYEPWSPRAGGREYGHAVSYSMPVEELFNVIVPQFSGMLGSYWGRNFIHLHSEYAGVVVLLLAGAGMFSGALPRRVRWFWLGVGGVSLLWALGGSTPFYYLVYKLVPGTSSFRAPSTMMFVTMFTLAVFAALGTERILGAAGSLSNKYFVGWGIGIVVISLLLIPIATSVATSIGTSMAAASGNQAYVTHFVDRARENQGALIRGALRSIVVLYLGLGLIWAARRGMFGGRERVLAAALALLVALDLWTIERRYWIFSERATALFATDPAIEALKAAPEPGRVLAWDPTRMLQTRSITPATTMDPAFRGQDGAGRGDALMAHRLRSVTGYHGNELGRYQQLDSPPADLRDWNLLRPELWRHENVRYLYTTIPDSLIGQFATQLQWPAAPTKIVGPVTNAAGSTVYLYQLPGANPAAWVASVMVRGTDEQALGTVLDARFDPLRAAIVDTAAQVPVVGLESLPAATGVQAKVTRYDPGRINVQLDGPVPSGAALVVSENFYPGWSATAGGQGAPVVRANFNLIGVALPAGAREVELRFVDAAYQVGKTITLIALALTVAAIGVGVFLSRRHARPAAAA